MRKIEIAPGTVYNKWVVLGEHPDRDCRGEILFLCRCECGREMLQKSSNIRHGKSKGCRDCNSLHGKTDQIHSSYMEGIANRTKKVNRSVTITAQDLQEQWDLQKGVCALTGLPLELRTGGHDRKATASVDRIDSDVGYFPDNIQWVHKDVNRMKSYYTEARFFEICKLVIEHKDQTVKLREGRRKWHADRS